MNKPTLRSTHGHTFRITGQLSTLGGQCSGLDLAVPAAARTAIAS